MKSMLSVVATMAIFAVGIQCAPAEAAGKKVEKAGDFYSVTVSSQKGKTQLRVEGKNGYHCNTSYPWKLTLGEGAEQKVLKKEHARKFTEKEVVFTFDGENSKALLKMSMCNDKQCKMEKIPLSW